MLVTKGLPYSFLLVFPGILIYNFFMCNLLIWTFSHVYLRFSSVETIFHKSFVQFIVNGNVIFKHFQSCISSGQVVSRNPAHRAGRKCYKNKPAVADSGNKRLTNIVWQQWLQQKNQFCDRPCILHISAVTKPCRTPSI